MSYLRIIGLLLALGAGLVACRPDAAVLATAATAGIAKKSSSSVTASDLELLSDDIGKVDRRISKTDERFDAFVERYEEQEARDRAFTRELLEDLERVKREKEEVEASYEAFLEKVVGDDSKDTDRSLRPTRRNR